MLGQMLGQILDYNLQTSSGIITSDIGQRYSFVSSDLKSTDTIPKQNDKVNFIDYGTEAREIYIVNHVQKKQIVPYQNTQVSIAAISSMVFGIFGLFFTWWVIGLPSIIAIITGHIARSNIKRSNGLLRGDGFAIAGLILGYLIMIIYLSVIFLFAGTLALLISNAKL